MSEYPVNVRVASWLGAKCIRHFCLQRNIEFPELLEFCEYIESIVSTYDVPEWDAKGETLKISGLGQCLPSKMTSIDNLETLIQTVHEISASQIYGAHIPEQVNAYLKKAVNISKLDIVKAYNLHSLSQIDLGNEGWGEPIEQTILNESKYTT